MQPNLPTANNNPGDLRYIGQSGATQGKGGFAGFQDPKTGYAALLNDIQTKINNKPNANLVDFASEYAPASDGNNVAQYAANLANKLGVAPNATLGSLEPKIGDLAQAIASNEGYISSPSADSNLPGVGALGSQIANQVSQETPTPATPPPAPISTGSAGQSLGTPDPSKNPVTAASNLTNALGLKGVTDTFGQDIAHFSNPSLSEKGLLPLPSAEQNIGAVAQTAGTVGSLALAPETLPGMIAAGAGVGAASQAGQAATLNEPLQQVGQEGLEGGLIGGVTAGVSGGFGKILGSIGDKIQYSEIKPTKPDLEDGFSLQTIKDNNLGGTLHQVLSKTQAKLSDLQSQLSAKLGSSKVKIDLAPIYDKTVNDLKTGNNLMRGFGANTNMDSALTHLQNEVLTVNPDGGISIPDAQLVKQGAGGMGAWEYGKTDPDATARQSVYNKFYSNLKTAIENASPPGVSEINAQMSKLIPVQNAVLRRLPVAARNNPLSLTDFIGLVSSAAHPAALGPTILNFLSKSGAVGNVLSKYAPSTGGFLAPKAAGVMSGLLTPQSTTSQ